MKIFFEILVRISSQWQISVIILSRNSWEFDRGWCIHHLCIRCMQRDVCRGWCIHLFDRDMTNIKLATIVGICATIVAQIAYSIHFSGTISLLYPQYLVVQIAYLICNNGPNSIPYTIYTIVGRIAYIICTQ